MQDKKDAVDYGVEKTSDAIDKVVNVADSFIDWLTGGSSDTSSKTDDDDKKDDLDCHCTKKK